MTIIKKENFDSDIFKLNVYMVILKGNATKSGDFKEILNIKSSIVYCSTPILLDNIAFLQKNNFDFISIKNTYSFQIKFTKNKIKNIFPLHIKNKKEMRLYVNSDTIRSFSNLIGSTSRYYKDKKIPKRYSRAIYDNWLRNSIFGDYSDEAFAVFDNQKIVGLITLKIQNKKGIIDLIGVRKNYQRKGLGMALIQQSINYFISKKMKTIVVATEGENISANSFYQKSGFIIKKTEFIYHKHIN